MIALVIPILFLLVITMFLFSSIDCTISTITSNELTLTASSGQCENTKSTLLSVISFLPIILLLPVFIIMFGIFGGVSELNIKNIEDRAKMMQKKGIDHMIRKNKGKIIDRSKRGNELYELKLIPGYPLKYLKYEDPSTPGKMYGCFVPSDITRADEAMAWKFYITEEEYEELTIEA